MYWSKTIGGCASCDRLQISTWAPDSARKSRCSNFYLFIFSHLVSYLSIWAANFFWQRTIKAADTSELDGTSCAFLSTSRELSKDTSHYKEPLFPTGRFDITDYHLLPIENLNSITLTSTHFSAGVLFQYAQHTKRIC